MPTQIAVATTEPIDLHFAIVTPDIRAHKFIADRCFVLGPSNPGYRLHGHVLTEEPAHRGKNLDGWVRWALVESGLMAPAEVGLIVPIQMDIGWKDHEADA